MRRHRSLHVVALLSRLANAAFDIAFGSDSDLTSYHSRPDIKVPILDVKIHDREAYVPGYYFVAPYVEIIQESHPRNYYQSCQTGPAIYDSEGELVWTGACKFRNQNACDFRVQSINGSDHLSAILYQYEKDNKGHGFVLNNELQEVMQIRPPLLTLPLNMHELQILQRPDGGWSQLHISSLPVASDVRSLQLANGREEGWITDTGIREVDAATGELLFEWWPLDHISLTESTTAVNLLPGPYPNGWNWFHANSIDKNPDGDYLFNSRWLNAMYRISSNGTLLWKLGGLDSTFQLQHFNFSRQHDARWLASNDDTEIISFLDNGGCPDTRTSNVSSALIVELDKRADPPTARVLSRIWRPDGDVSQLRGNYQIFHPEDAAQDRISSGSALVGWSDNAYMTEHSLSDGRLVAEAQFRSDRFVTYRSYKFNFTSRPVDEKPMVESSVFGMTQESAITVAYVSWNGATEVALWRLYDASASNSAGGNVICAESPRTGFETMLQAPGFIREVFAEAVDVDGNVLGRSEADRITPLSSWRKAQPAVALDDQGDGLAQRANSAAQSDGGHSAYHWKNEPEVAANLVQVHDTEL